MVVWGRAENTHFFVFHGALALNWKEYLGAFNIWFNI